ncbi:restriction endonuclease subunit S [uncultured Campylobacter sp.]|uniref:restriction endonuclease subunit S n=1 Tax=uncultured Campylobacter sp. TaxID=218934 RepID=UPI0025DB8F4D|nr:restriction endonuclease subunit S [uncultured Campylobacter sp.]
MSKQNMEFKDSGIPWIGQIPKHWEVTKINHLYSQRNQKVSDKDFEPLSVTKKGILPQLENAAKTDNGDNRKLVKIGDFVINSRSDRRGSCGISSFDGSVSLINIVLKPRENMNSKYFDWLFHTTLFADEFYKYGNGIVDDLWSTRWDNMKNILVPYPPLNEQKKIAEFLDKKCEIIDKRLSNLERKIKSLKEYKKSLISECVTTGLNPKNMEFKDSGIPWIGQIPKHWEIKKLKYIATRIYKGSGITKEQVFENGDTSCVRYGEIYTKYNYSFDKCFSYTFEKVLNSTSYFGYGDILFTCTGELIEEIGKNVVYLGDKKCLAGSDIIILNHKQNPSFLNYALDCNYARNQKSYGKAKLKVVHISSREISNLFVVLPPLNEQKEIAEFLDKKCEKIDRLNENYTKQITALKEYKKSLIYECVTGKKEI